MRAFQFIAVLWAAVLLGAIAAPPAWAADDDKPEAALKFRFLGPDVGNRFASVAGVPGDNSTWYAGASSGGVWKSTDGGSHWTPIFDDQSVAAIGALAIAPSNPKIVWAGTGEAWAIRDADVGGDGVYRSLDAGKTWTHMGLDKVGRVGRIIVDPANPDSVYVCALGRMTAPQEERGVFHTADGGKTWTRSLFVDANTGCSGLSMDAHDSKTLFAGMWQVEMHTWAELSGGSGSGVYVSHDGGATWTHLDKGLPNSPVGKIDVAVAPNDSKRVYALIETNGQGAMWRSDDGGQSWNVSSWDRSLIGRAGYYIRLAVSPTDENKVFVSSSSFHVSRDGGKTFPTEPWGGDNHDVWVDPKNADRFAITFDGGVAITTTGDKGVHSVSLPVGQMYHVAVDDQIPYFVYGNMQDDGTMRGPSVPRGGGGWGPQAAYNGWDYTMGGCESGFTVPDTVDPDIVWATCYGDEVTRWNSKTRHARSVSPWLHTLDFAPNQAKYRCHWTAPLALDPFDHNTAYYGCQVMFKSSNGGQSWSVISPDLSTQDPSRIRASGGLIGDNLGQFYGEVIFAIAPSTVSRGLIWAGTNDGKVWYTKTGGGQWNDVTKNITGMPAWGVVTSIQPSFFDAATAYVSVDAHLVDDRDPYIFKTTDFGKNWTKISGGMPKGELSYVRNVSEDPNARGLLFAGTGNALQYSPDDGATWTRLKESLPPSPVTWTVVQKRFHDLVLSTWGRGFYILDDITPLEQKAQRPTTEPVRLFTPRPTYRLLDGDGVHINFELKAKPKAQVTIQILDAKGQAVRTIYKPAHEGLNRIDWDMRYDALRTIWLRTIPAEDPHIWEEARFKGKDYRPITHWGLSGRVPGPAAAPGKYRVRLTVDGQTQEVPVELIIDPHSDGSAADLGASLKLQLRVADDIGKAGDMGNMIEQMRKQLEDLRPKLSGKDADTLAAVDAMDQKLQAVEYDLFAKQMAASDDKSFITDHKVYFDLLWFNAEIGGGAGDVAGGGEQRPTDTAPVLLDGMEKDLDGVSTRYHALMGSDVTTFNQMLTAKGYAPLDLKLKPQPSADVKYPFEDAPGADND